MEKRFGFQQKKEENIKMKIYNLYTACGNDDEVDIKDFFDNGYGVSIIRNQYSYGGKDGLFEMAILIGDEFDHSICYDTPLTSDVFGYMNIEELNKSINDVRNLPKTIQKNREDRLDEII